MLLFRAVLVSVSLSSMALVGAGAGLSPAEAGLPTVSRGGRAYVDASSLATHLKAKLEATPGRLYLRTRTHVVTLTQDWARVEIDGKPVVLEAPVRVENQRWLVPEVFMRQVVPILEGKAALPAPAPAPAAGHVAASGVAPSMSAPPAPVPAAPFPTLSAAAPVVRPPAPPSPAAVTPPLVEAPVARPSAAPSPTLIAVAPRPVPAVSPTLPGAQGLPRVSAKASAIALSDVRLRSYPTFTRVVVETSAAVRYRVESTTPRETRIRLDSVSAGPRIDEIRDGLVDEVRLEPAGEDAMVRVMFSGTGVEPKVSTLSDPPRLLLDFPRPLEPGARTGPVAVTPLRTIVLDAGHGGHDPGAQGPTGLQEKDLVLDVTRRVSKLVETSFPGLKVLLSRKGDYFVPLRERTSFANRERADLFVSIHANAHREAASEGVETFFLSSEATDNAARQMAAAENSVVQLEKPAFKGSRADAVKAILWDLAQSEFQQESSRLAEVVQDSMTESLRIPNRGVKQAGFYVLGGAAMPAVLIEIGFVTNPREERRLKDMRYRDEIARAIAAGIADYKRELDRRAARAAAR